MPPINQKTINITLGIVAAVLIVSVSAFIINTNGRLKFLEGKVS